MRPLQLQTLNMSGPDVSDWQTFLTNQRLLQSAVDGKFGPNSDRATRAYQTQSGLTTDGIVNSGVLAKARTDGYITTTGAGLAGVDANVNCAPFAAQIVADGVTFVARYYSNSAAKTLTVAEARALSAAGLDIVTVFENSNNSAAAFSSAVGQSQVQKALELAAAMGQPANSAIYFAVDYDAAPADVQGPVTDYFNAIQEALAAAPVQYLVGVYGSGLTCGSIQSAGLARFTWLTGSTGFRDYAAFRAQADIVQLAPQRQVFNAHLTVDDDIAQSAAYGAFQLALSNTAIT